MLQHIEVTLVRHLLEPRSEAHPELTARIGPAKGDAAGADLALTVGGESLGLIPRAAVARLAEDITRHPSLDPAAVLSQAGFAWPQSLDGSITARQAVIVALPAWNCLGGDIGDGSPIQPDELLRDRFLIPASDPISRPASVYLPVNDPFIGEKPECLAHLVKLGLLGHLSFTLDGPQTVRHERWFTPVMIPLVAGHLFDGGPMIQGRHARVWRRIRFFMEMAWRRELPLEMQGKPDLALGGD